MLQFQACCSRHSVAAIVKVALQPGTSVSPISVVNAVPLVAATTGHNTIAILNLQSAAINSCAVVPSTVQMSTSTPLVAVPAVPNNLGNQHTAAGVSNTVVTQSNCLSVSHVTATPRFYISVLPNFHLCSYFTITLQARNFWVSALAHVWVNSFWDNLECEQSLYSSKIRGEQHEKQY